MPPKRPPPLPRSLFTDGGLLSPGAVPAPPSPSKIHPGFVTDAHARGALALPAGPNQPPVTGVIAVGGDVPAGDKTKVVTPVVVDDTSLPGTITADESFIDLVVPNTAPLTEAQWDHLEEVVNQIDGGFKVVEGEVAQSGDAKRKIIIAGLLPPPLTKPSSPLLQSDDYALYQGRLAQLSLHADVILKALPPVADPAIAGANGDKWWEDAHEVDRVVKMYVAPAIETFGTHRIVFGSAPATSEDVAVPVNGGDWYALFRKTVSELGEDQEAMNNLMGVNAQQLYGL